MGAREVNFHNEHMRRMGYAAEAERIQELYLAGRKDEAIAAVPDEYVDERCLVGSAGRGSASATRAWAESGITGMSLATSQPARARAARRLRPRAPRRRRHASGAPTSPAPPAASCAGVAGSAQRGPTVDQVGHVERGSEHVLADADDVVAGRRPGLLDERDHGDGRGLGIEHRGADPGRPVLAVAVDLADEALADEPLVQALGDRRRPLRPAIVRQRLRRCW